MKVSVVIPTYNRGRQVRRAVDTALAQTLSDLEVIVVDDGSTDETQEVIEAYEDDRLQYIKHSENRGGSAARNTGIDAASGDYIAFLDSDDTWVPSKLEEQIAVIERRSGEWVAAYCDFRQRRRSRLAEKVDNVIRRPTGFEGNEEILNRIFLRTFAHGGASTLVIKRDTVEEIGGFDPSFQRHQDLEFLVRVLKNGKLAYVDRVLVHKHDTGNPPVEVVRSAMEQFNEKFEDEIRSRGLSEEVYRRQQFMIAKYHFRNGDFRRGVIDLRGSKCPHYRDAVSLCVGGVSGMIREIGRVS